MDRDGPSCSIKYTYTKKPRKMTLKQAQAKTSKRLQGLQTKKETVRALQDTPGHVVANFFAGLCKVVLARLYHSLCHLKFDSLKS